MNSGLEMCVKERHKGSAELTSLHLEQILLLFNVVK